MVELAQTRLNRFGHRVEVRVTDGSVAVAVSSNVFDLLSENDTDAVHSEAQQFYGLGGCSASSVFPTDLRLNHDFLHASWLP